ncbi:MAG: ATP synthase F1 subunit delta [Candidatus Bipolaricaulota bacterium]|nr:MAG: ATP synthase F1 subunit delta [Candidatus Bipolaricaulota bacterium]
MISRDIARRYAEALYDLAAEEKSLDAVGDQVGSLVDSLSETPDARTFLVHPLVPRQRKMAFLDAAFPGLSDSVRGLLGIVIRNAREDHLWLIREEFDAIRVARAGVQRVAVSSASALSDAARERITDRLVEILGRPVELAETVEEELLGGVRVEVEGIVVDGTLRGRLDRLFERLEG